MLNQKPTIRNQQSGRLEIWVFFAVTLLQFQSPMRTLAQPNRISKVCSGQQHNPLIIRSGNGSIVHPLPPQKKYAKNELCQWNFILPQSQLLILTFKGKFDIEPGRRDGLCRDYLQILPGQQLCQQPEPCYQSGTLNNWCQPVQFHGQCTRIPANIIHTNNTFYTQTKITFESDGKGEKGGFELNYWIIDCAGGPSQVKPGTTLTGVVSNFSTRPTNQAKPNKPQNVGLYIALAVSLSLMLLALTLLVCLIRKKGIFLHREPDITSDTQMIYSLANDVNIKPSVQVGNDATYSECGPAGHYSSVDNALYGPTNNAAKPPQGGDQVTPRGKVVANQLYSPLP